MKMNLANPGSKVILFLALLFCASPLQAQQEKKTSVRIDQRAAFFEVNARYQLELDTVFHTNSGFRINPEYDIHRIGEDDYVILSYPDFTDNGEQMVIERSEPSKMLLEDGGRNDSPAIHMEICRKINDTISVAINGKLLAMKRSDFEKLEKTDFYSIKWNKPENYTFSSGIMTVPFKLRPKIDSNKFNITTDITLGAYFGFTKRISRYQRNYLTVPFTLGLSYINIDNNNTSNIAPESIVGVVPGVTWSTGVVLQLRDFNTGIILGQDFASGVGNDWKYNGKLWVSFAIGYNFLAQEED